MQPGRMIQEPPVVQVQADTGVYVPFRSCVAFMLRDGSRDGKKLSGNG